ncbi:hypothetical protein [Phenylobacterium sp.]
MRKASERIALSAEGARDADMGTQARFEQLKGVTVLSARAAGSMIQGKA